MVAPAPVNFTAVSKFQETKTGLELELGGLGKGAATAELLRSGLCFHQEGGRNRPD